MGARKAVLCRPVCPIVIALTVSSLMIDCLSVARADVSMTAQQVTSSGQTPLASRTIRLFLKGANARLEVAGEPILLYDGKGNILYGVDPVRRTYYMTVPTEIEPTYLPPGPGSEAGETVKLDLRPTPQAMDLAGLTAHQYMISGTVAYTRPEGFRRGGRRRSGGGGGGYGNGGPDGRSRREPLLLPHWSISGEIWLSDTLKFPARENTLLAAQIAAVAAGPFQQPLADALDKHKGVPLLARITVTRTPALPLGGAAEGTGDAVPPVPASTATTLSVQSVSTATLDDKFFQPPIDDTLVAAPLDAYNPNSPGG